MKKVLTILFGPIQDVDADYGIFYYTWCGKDYFEKRGYLCSGGVVSSLFIDLDVPYSEEDVEWIEEALCEEGLIDEECRCEAYRKIEDGECFESENFIIKFIFDNRLDM